MPIPTTSLTSLAGNSVALHDRVVNGDHEAVETIAAWSIRELSGRLGRKFPRAPDDQVHDAVVDAVIHYAAAPNQFDRAKGVSLEFFLYYASRKNLSNLLEASARRRNREAEYAAVRDRLHDAGRASQGSGMWLSEAYRKMNGVMLDERERRMITEWMRGERRTRNLASAYGISNLPPEDQQKEIKRAKDRIVRRIRRKFGVRHSC